MCRFKSGIILKSRSYIAEEDNDSHTDLLEKLNIEDTIENAMRKFVRVELIPDNNEWWTNPENWKINIDQDILPDWFEEDRNKYLKEFREHVIEWWNNHVFVDKIIEKLEDGYYRLKRCEVKKLLNDAKVMCDNSTVKEMYGNATVKEMSHNSTVKEMYGNATVKEMSHNSTVKEMWDNATVQRMCDNSTVKEMWDNSTVKEMWENSTVKEMWDNSTVKRMCDNSTVKEMCDNSTVKEMWENSTVKEMWDNSTVKRMWDNATVKEMYGDSIIARDLENNVVVAESNDKVLKKHKNR